MSTTSKPNWPRCRHASGRRSWPPGTPRKTCSTCSRWPVNPNRERVAELLYRFYRRCAHADLPELARLATTVQTWWPQILAFLHTGITNAGSEGTNRVIKTVARDAYGFRNPVNQRLRTRCATVASRSICRSVIALTCPSPHASPSTSRAGFSSDLADFRAASVRRAAGAGSPPLSLRHRPVFATRFAIAPPARHFS
ncbi:transposase [Micromonospora sp. WMMA1363]|uniref:transposase n=1 Tax=Micromonospora sp. WMMA1363 TaxID=3053985 RepID=UPI00259CBDDC|nr:transposase [Micromonospora sp. WMMA1363]MDM4723441.1 transposase [Micromonospora sp. WMMA1363]MDM4723597.1 transposase [Micromonospora sp. WMMA1363]